MYLKPTIEKYNYYKICQNSSLRVLFPALYCRFCINILLFFSEALLSLLSTPLSNPSGINDAGNAACQCRPDFH